MQRTHRHYRDPLRLALTRDDIGVPFVGVDGRATRLPDGSQPTQVGTVGVRQYDVLQICDRPDDALYLVKDALAIGIPQGIDHRQFRTIIEQESMDVAAFLL